MEEPNTNLKDERIRKDKESVIKVVAEVLHVPIKEADISEAIRLGKNKEENVKRPLLITVKDERMKESIFSKLANLKDSEYNVLSFTHDMTKLEREHFKKMVVEAKRLEADSVGKFRFRVRGPPWDMKIFKREVKRDPTDQSQTQRQPMVVEVEEGK